MRTLLLAMVIVGFLGLGLGDIAYGDVRQGAAAILLAAANLLLLSSS